MFKEASAPKIFWTGHGTLSFLQMEYIWGRLLQGYSLWIQGTTDENSRRNPDETMYILTKDLLEDGNGFVYLLMVIEEVMGKFATLRQGLYGSSIEIILAPDGDKTVNAANGFQRLIKMRE